MSKFFKDLKKGLEEIVEYKKGKTKLRSEIIEIPKAPVVFWEHLMYKGYIEKNSEPKAFKLL